MITLYVWIGKSMCTHRYPNYTLANFMLTHFIHLYTKLDTTKGILEPMNPVKLVHTIEKNYDFDGR